MSEDGIPEASPNPESQPKSESKNRPFKVEVLEKISTLMAAAFGFVAAFAWNETFKVLLLSGLAEKDSPIVLIGYALLVTILAVVLTIAVARAAAKARRSLQ